MSPRRIQRNELNSDDDEFSANDQEDFDEDDGDEDYSDDEECASQEDEKEFNQEDGASTQDSCCGTSNHSSNVKTCLRNPTNCTNKIPSQPTISTKQGQTSKKSKKKTYQGDLAQRKKVRRNKKRNANDMHINQETMMPSQPKQNIPDQTSVLTKKQKKKARKTRRRAKNKLKREETALPTRIHSPYIIQPSFNNNILPYINLVNNIAQSQMIYNHQLNVSILNAINSNSNSNQQRTFPNELPPMLTVPTDLSHPYGKT